MGFESRIEEAKKEARRRMHPVARGMATSAEDQVRSLMRRSTPTGERYPDPGGGTYVASAPGQPPAVRTREYLTSYGSTDAIDRASRVVAAVTNDRMVGGGTPLWAILEYGTFSQAARPHVRPSAEEAARGFQRAVRDTGGGREMRRAA